jgi:hypothetical protein
MAKAAGEGLLIAEKYASDNQQLALSNTICIV